MTSHPSPWTLNLWWWSHAWCLMSRSSMGASFLMMSFHLVVLRHDPWVMRRDLWWWLHLFMEGRGLFWHLFNTRHLLRGHFYVLSLYLYIWGYCWGRPWPIQLMSWIFCVFRDLRVYRTGVASYKKASAPHCQNKNHTCGETSLLVFFYLSSSWSTYAHLWKIDLVDVFLVLVDVSRN